MVELIMAAAAAAAGHPSVPPSLRRLARSARGDVIEEDEFMRGEEAKRFNLADVISCSILSQSWLSAEAAVGLGEQNVPVSFLTPTLRYY